MIVTNAAHETAIVIRRDGQTANLVRLRGGKLGVERLTESEFRALWREAHFPLQLTLDRFIEHAQLHGATQEALRGLTRLRERDAHFIDSLF